MGSQTSESCRVSYYRLILTTFDGENTYSTITQVSSIEIFNSVGEQVYESIGFQSTLNLSNKASGEYFVQIHLPSKTVNLEVVVAK